MDKIVLITGCSSGIGRALAEAWHAKGNIVYAGARSPEKLKELAEIGLRAVQLDVTDEKEIMKVLKRIEKEQGRLDILVNNAGYGAIGPLVEMPLQELLGQFETNVFAAMRLIQAALPLLRQAQQSTVVQIGSVSADFVTPFAGAYCASKAALHALSEALRMELIPFGIRVIIVAPGAIRSHFGNNAEKRLIKTVPANSLYHPILAGIQARARASQAHPTPVEVLVRKIMREVEKTNPRPILRIGTGALLLLYMKRSLPTKILDNILMKRFLLNKLKP